MPICNSTSLSSDGLKRAQLVDVSDHVKISFCRGGRLLVQSKSVTQTGNPLGSINPTVTKVSIT